MSEYTTRVGMGVHARGVSCKALRPDTGECWSKTFSGEGHERELLEWLKKPPAPARCAYGSGCTGFWLSRFLGNEGIACEAMAVSTLPRSPKNKRHKDGRHDAGAVLCEMCNPASDVCKRYADFVPALRSHLQPSGLWEVVSSEAAAAMRGMCYDEGRRNARGGSRAAPSTVAKDR